jgi:c(7)-type cytochrome triheme protein
MTGNGPDRRTFNVRSLGFCALLVVAGIVAAMLSPAVGPAQPKMPEPFNFPQGKDSPGQVSFSHTQHRDAGVDKCTACHTKVFKFKKGETGPLTMAKMKAGEQCGTCHNGTAKVGTKVVFAADDKANCEKCHKK